VGSRPPFQHHVFVLTHHAREPLVLEGGTTFTFVTSGIEAALEAARRAAGGRDVSLAGGAKAAQQYVAAGLVDEMEISLAPTLLGSVSSCSNDDLHGLEREHLPLAVETGLSLIPWSPLASGFLTGKYRRVDGRITGSGRVFELKDSENPVLAKFANRQKYWAILGAVLQAAEQTGRTATGRSVSGCRRRAGLHETR
jgi:RibD C-terminal domain